MSNQTKKKAKGVDLSGLDKFSISSFLEAPNGEEPPKKEDIKKTTGLVFSPLDHFHEDLENARVDFNQDKLQELAETIKWVNPKTGKTRGVLDPLSVKHHPNIPGHFIINSGARRYRAAVIAGLKELPYVIPDEMDNFDKFILNDQREDLSPKEISAFIVERLDEGLKSGEIAKSLGKLPSYVSDHSVFFKLDPCIRELYENGVCRSMQVLAILHRAHKKHRATIEIFCKKSNDEKNNLTLSKVRDFVGLIKTAEKMPDNKQIKESNNPVGINPNPLNKSEEQPPHRCEQANQEKPMCTITTEIKVIHLGNEAKLLTNRLATYGSAWVVYNDNSEKEVELNQVELIAVVEV